MILQGIGARNAGGKIERVHIPTAGTIAKLESPQAWDVDRVAVFIFQDVDETTAGGIEDINRSVAEVSDQKIAAEISKTRRRERQTPRRIQRPIRGQALQEVTVEVVDIDVTVPRTSHIVVLGSILLPIRPFQFPITIFYIKPVV